MLEDATGRLDEAIRFAERAEAIEASADTGLLLARRDMILGRTEAAIDRCHRVLRADPARTQARLLLATVLESAVRLDEAESALAELERDLRREPGLADSPVGAQVQRLAAAVLVHRARHGEAIEALDHTVLDPRRAGGLRETDAAGLREAWYLRAKACDRAGRYDEAFESASRANEIGRVDFDPQGYEEAIGALMSHWTRDAMHDFPQSHGGSELAVFIAGMPRSGTSLLDQVIDAHGEAAGVGEMATIEHFARTLEQVWDATLPAPESFGSMRDRAFKQAASAYLRECERAAPGARRVVNKALGNNRIVGLLARLFPRTRIVHAMRDPRDVAISCFMGGFNNQVYPWTTRLDWIAAAWAQSLRLMEHWKRETDLPILEVRYESLVADPATQFPRVIEFLGLPWDEGCTRFHESRRVVRTLSYDQVNRPLYTTSVARWRHYERHLKGIDWPAYEP